MKYAIAILVLMMLLLTTGCIPFSLYPIYTDDTLIFEPALLGSWTDADKSTTYSFISNGEKGYSLIIKNDSDGPAYFEAYFADIGGTVFLDLYPDIRVLGDGDYDGHLIQLHSFYVVEQFEPTLKVLPIYLDWLLAYLQNEPGGIDYEIFNDTLVFSAETEDMQAFLLGISEDGIGFFRTMEMERLTSDF